MTRVEIHLGDTNVNKTGLHDMHCMLEVRLEGLQPTVVKESAANVERAAKGAAVKMRHSLENISRKKIGPSLKFPRAIRAQTDNSY